MKTEFNERKNKTKKVFISLVFKAKCKLIDSDTKLLKKILAQMNYLKFCPKKQIYTITLYLIVFLMMMNFQTSIQKKIPTTHSKFWDVLIIRIFGVVI